MSETAFFLLAASMIGAFDVLWWHLYKFRLYDQPGSVLEEVTHLVRYLLFLGIAVTLVTADDPRGVQWFVVALFAADIAVTTVDVLAEPASRAPLGGLPRLEYLVHILATFLLGGAAATFWWSAQRGGTPLTAFDDVRLVVAIGLTATLLMVETALFARSRHRAQREARGGRIAAGCCA
ncbi:MAG: hypothetical protein ACK4V6_02060 [Microthrixaceae bacterium]